MEHPHTAHTAGAFGAAPHVGFHNTPPAMRNYCSDAELLQRAEGSGGSELGWMRGGVSAPHCIQQGEHRRPHQSYKTDFPPCVQFTGSLLEEKKYTTKRDLHHQAQLS